MQLRAQGVTVRFGGLVAVDEVSISLARGEILGLIGPNGAGKTTLFNCLSRLYQPSQGDILMEGQSILTKPPHRICDIGIGRTFQNVALFPRMSVADNTRVGAHHHDTGAGPDSSRINNVRCRYKRHGSESGCITIDSGEYVSSGNNLRN